MALLLLLLLLPAQVPRVAQGHTVAEGKVHLLLLVLGGAAVVLQSGMARQLLLAPVQLAALLTGVVAPLLSARTAVMAERRAQIGGGMRPLPSLGSWPCRGCLCLSSNSRLEAANARLLGLPCQKRGAAAGQLLQPLHDCQERGAAAGRRAQHRHHCHLQDR